MAKTSTVSSFSSFPSLSRGRETHSFLPTSFRFSNRPSRFLRLSSKASDSGSFFSDDSFGFFPWSPGDNDVEWVQEERVTLFTSDGLIQIGGSMVARRITFADKKRGKSKTSQRFQRFQESDYMDPNQGLCLGALFDIAATNGLDMGRRLCIIGFCRSIEMLSDVVEDTVLEHGGEVVAAEKASKGGLHEKLTMKVAVPYLWGVPPASDTLHLAVRSGGGIVEKVYWQWDFL
ncbi:uncharacterized protein LOC111311028 isoform X1 [Durio zibethinus]|uniref:Uncharacterized protein LOC111311028 isoform X1 n=1 Tax=Durio zibethinus TaxID=66656 RepID=A0A6P6AMV6_DURZI|nr:uncharacterized protein LOC111311028 isoform X1 [Durio zibethinus]